MPFHAVDLNQDVLSKLQAQEQFPQVQEQKQEKVKIVKGTIQWQVSLALEMMKDWKTPVIDVSKLPQYASNWPVTKEQITISKISAETFQDISKLSPKAQEEFIAIYNEFQKNNPWKMFWKSNPYWGAIKEAVEIKNEVTWNLQELEQWKKAIEKAVWQSWIAHNPRWVEWNVYNYFKYKLWFLERVEDNQLLDLVLKWEQEYTRNVRKWKDAMFYKFLNYLTKIKIRIFMTKALEKYSPNFYKELSNLLLTKKSKLVFSQEFYDIIKNEEKARKNEEKAKLLEEITNQLKKAL